MTAKSVCMKIRYSGFYTHVQVSKRNRKSRSPIKTYRILAKGNLKYVTISFVIKGKDMSPHVAHEIPISRTA